MKLSPLKLEMLCQIYWNPNFVVSPSPAHLAAINDFVLNGLIQTPKMRPGQHRGKSEYELSSRGKAFLHCILSTPLPERAETWINPKTGELIK